jgi:hypothetical protein
MKKYIIYTFIIGILLAGCNPNKDIYENIKNNTPDYHTDFSITLSDADYATISDLAVDAAETDEEIAKAESIAENLYFSVRVPASNYIGAFLDQEYIAPDSTSSCKVTFNYSVNEYDSLSLFTLTADDYTAIGGVVADSAAFTYNELPSEYLPDYLATLDQTGNYICYVTCSYWANDTTLIDTAMAYEYINDEWAVNPDVYTITDQDYESMGSPGTYHNFSSSALPENYLPIFLNLKFPYESVGSKMFIVYKYYASGKTNILMDGWYYKGSTQWVNSLPKTEQFIHNGTQWLFDPTVHHTMVKADYQIIVEYVAAHPDLNVYMDPVYNNTEYYYGASYFYENFDMRLYKRRDNDPFGLLTGLTDDEVRVVITERLKEGIGIFLELRFPDAQPVSNGIQVYYEVYYATYEPGDYFYKMKFKCTDVGQFEYVEGPISLN